MRISSIGATTELLDAPGIASEGVAPLTWSGQLSQTHHHCAGAHAGAGSLTTFRKITLPLIAPAFSSGLVFAFVRVMTAINAAIFLVSAEWSIAKRRGRGLRQSRLCVRKRRTRMRSSVFSRGPSGE
ncbi:MAG: hypothetical protein ABIR55_17730 [Burkholderiaceae bacterium]